MVGQLSKPTTRTTTGVMISDPAQVTSFGLAAGSDAATAEFYDGADGSGQPLWVLKAVATAYAGQDFSTDLRFENGVYVVLTGTAPTAMMAIRRPRAA